MAAIFVLGFMIFCMFIQVSIEEWLSHRKRRGSMISIQDICEEELPL